MRCFPTLACLLIVASLSAETYVEPRVFGRSLELPPLRLIEAIEEGLTSNTSNECAVIDSRIVPACCIIDLDTPFSKATLPELRISPDASQVTSVLPGADWRPREMLITRDVALPQISLE